MRFITKSFKNGELVLNASEHISIFQEIKEVISGISDEDIKVRHETRHSGNKSLSVAINELLKERFIEKGWSKESPIFQGEEFTDNKWRLDFAKGTVSIEVAFNHGEAIAWNLLKPVLASEQNHIQKAIQTEVGVLICATKDLKTNGGFDGAVGEYEKICRYLVPLDRVLTVPMLIIGLEPMETFKITHEQIGNKKIGKIISI